MEFERALQVEGWLSLPEMEYLASKASKSTLTVEIGSFQGRSTCAMACNTNGLIVAVDTWNGSPEHAGMLSHKPKDWLYETFLKNVDGLPVQPLRMTSLEAAQRLQIRPDFIFIDASHAYEDVKADILAWLPHLAEGGTLCGHDFYGDWPGVRQAVQELLQFRTIENTSIWEAL